MDSIDFYLEEELWKLEGNCVDEPVDLFFDLYEDYPDAANHVDEICASCPVRQMCFDYGVKNDMTGVWSGTYLVLGKYSRSRNSHKPKDQMAREEQGVQDARSNI